jgi:hypothetical protein
VNHWCPEALPFFLTAFHCWASSLYPKFSLGTIKALNSNKLSFVYPEQLSWDTGMINNNKDHTISYKSRCDKLLPLAPSARIKRYHFRHKMLMVAKERNERPHS